MDDKLVCTVPVFPEDRLLRAWIEKVRAQQNGHGYITEAIVYAIRQYRENAQCVTIAAICTKNLQPAEYRSTLTFRYDNKDDIKEWVQLLKEEKIPVGRAVKTILLGSIREVEQESEEFIATDFYTKKSNESFLKRLEHFTKKMESSQAAAHLGKQEVTGTKAETGQNTAKRTENKNKVNNPLVAFLAGK